MAAGGAYLRFGRGGAQGGNDRLVLSRREIVCGPFFAAGLGESAPGEAPLLGAAAASGELAHGAFFTAGS